MVSRPCGVPASFPQATKACRFARRRHHLARLQSWTATRRAQCDSLDVICELNQQRLDVAGGSKIAGRTNAYEMAFRLQAHVPELMNLSGENRKTLDVHGAKPGDAKARFANSCLLTRRLAEHSVHGRSTLSRGVGGHHCGVGGGIRTQCRQTDQSRRGIDSRPETARDVG